MTLLHKEYHAKEIVITENGLPLPRDKENPAVPSKIQDEERIRYMRGHISALSRAIDAGVPVTGYYVWSIEDTYEHGLGFDYDFGLIAVNYETMERTPRESFRWYADVIRYCSK